MPKALKPTKKTTKQPTTRKPAARAAKTKVAAKVSVSVVDVAGKAVGKMTLPRELFAVNVNKQLLAQSVRVHLANTRSGSASTKTRGEVEGSTRKIYKQKGTGKARHGGIRAPIFVGGGIALGPKPQDHSLSMPKKMQRMALASALTSQLIEGSILFVDGLADILPKTKHMAKVFAALGITGRALLVTCESAQQATCAARNLSSVDIIGARSIFPYAVLSHRHIVMMKEAVPVLSETFVRQKS